MKKLVIVESPAKVKTITKFLGKHFKVMSTLGHIKDLPTDELGVSIDKTIDITYTVLEKKDKVIADICKEASNATDIFVAPDPDREGEIIAWHIAQEIEKVNKKGAIHRIAFNEITKDAIEEALAHPHSIDLHKVSAQQARRVLDRLVGYEVSPVLWRKISKGLSAGRVQSVALKLICDREEEIRGFKPEESWSIEALFTCAKEQFAALLTHINKKKAELKNEEQAQEVVKKIEAVKDFSVSSIKDSKRAKNPPPPFMTSTLQQAAYNQLGFSVDRTMQLAQKLYEGVPLEDASTPVALITYMRTDSLRIADTALKAVRSFITKQYGSDYLPAKSAAYSNKDKAQDAHEAIRPIDISLTPQKVGPFLDPDLAKLYELIWKRFVACQMKSAQYAQRQVVVEGGIFIFKVTGSTLLFDGFLKVYAASDEEDEKEEKAVIPKDLAEKTALDNAKTTPKQHFTQPPSRYTQASLVKELEKEGIGRPSTYATIMKTIQARSYTEIDSKKRFVPTELGMAVTKMLSEHLPKIMNTKFTAQMEEELDKIAHGSLERDKVIREFYESLEKDLEAWRGSSQKKQHELTDITCPSCNEGKLVIRFGKTGSFLGCSRFPECPFTSNFERQEDGSIKLVEAEGPKLLDEKCPQCGKQLRQLVGKFGPFVACSGYPECKYIHKQKASFACPSCKTGEIYKRYWKGKTFWGCTNYPTCTFAIPSDIEDAPCPQCKNPYLLKRIDKQGTLYLSCPNKECGYQETR